MTLAASSRPDGRIDRDLALLKGEGPARLGIGEQVQQDLFFTTAWALEDKRIRVCSILYNIDDSIMDTNWVV